MTEAREQAAERDAYRERTAQCLGAARRVVVKVGSSLIVDAAAGRLEDRWLATLAADLAALRARGQEVLVVSSGAVALGRVELGLGRDRRLDTAQAAAAAGQIALADAWRRVLSAHRLKVAQVLLTLEDSEQRRRYVNARATIERLLALGAVPVVNENDTVATAEIRYGDNDRLAARVAQMASADCLVLLSDVDALYTADPTRVPESRPVDLVERIDAGIVAMAGESSSDLGSGGMITKLAAARVALGAGCHMAIASGRVDHPLRRLEQGGRCTWFVARQSPNKVRKQWIAGALRPAGALVIDGGAARALRRGSSLLPAGVLDVEGEFARGDAVVVRAADGAPLARGLIAYSAREARAIRGRHSRDIESLLGYRGRDELIHRDDLVMLDTLADSDS
jgi:glutamate 5-kinase